MRQSKAKSTRKSGKMTKYEFETKILTQMTEAVIKELEKLIAQGENPKWKCPWKQGKPRNAITGIEYKGINRFSFSMLGIKEVITPLQLKESNLAKHGTKTEKYARPKEGATLYPYIFYKPIPYTKTIENEDGTQEQVEKMGFAFNCYWGYDIRDIEGWETSQEEIPYNNENIPLAQEIVNSSDCPIKYTDAGAFYSVNDDYIQVADINHCSTSEEFYSSVFHEMGHSTGAKKRLNRDMTGSFKSDKYREEELIAEFTSVMLCEECGIANVTKDNSVAYLKGYITALRNDVRLLYRSASKAQKAFDWIINNKNKVKKEVVA